MNQRMNYFKACQGNHSQLLFFILEIFTILRCLVAAIYCCQHDWVFTLSKVIVNGIMILWGETHCCLYLVLTKKSKVYENMIAEDFFFMFWKYKAIEEHFWFHKEPFSQRFFKEPSLSYLFIIWRTSQMTFCEQKGSSDVEGSLWNHLDKKFILWHREAPLFYECKNHY